jgi:acetyltransferase-like isoleucine patch superfamily enzyme
VAAASYVEGIFPPRSCLAGNPARRVGEVVQEGSRARLVRHQGD